MVVNITAESQQPALIEKEAEQEIANFEKWFLTLGNTGKLIHSEVAILKTYLGWKLGMYKEKTKSGG